MDACAALIGGVPDLGGPQDTSRLTDILDRAPIPRGDAFLEVAGPFPVAGPSRWSNDWHVRRCEPYPHLHEGIDIFAPHGTPVVATVDGRISQRVDGDISGLAVELRGENGVQYFYAHLSSIAPGIVPGDAVEAGTVLGAIGTTGNARGTSPHLHFEIQPGGVPVPPKPFLDRWLADAEAQARTLTRTLRRSSGTDVAVGAVDRSPAPRQEPGRASYERSWAMSGPRGSLVAQTDRAFPGAAVVTVTVIALGLVLWLVRSRRRIGDPPAAPPPVRDPPAPARRRQGARGERFGPQRMRRHLDLAVGILSILVLAALAGRVNRATRR